MEDKKFISDNPLYEDVAQLIGDSWFQCIVKIDEKTKADSWNLSKEELQKIIHGQIRQELAKISTGSKVKFDNLNLKATGQYNFDGVKGEMIAMTVFELWDLLRAFSRLEKNEQLKILQKLELSVFKPGTDVAKESKAISFKK